jgi:cytochrome c oxidase subunit 4
LKPQGESPAGDAPVNTTTQPTPPDSSGHADAALAHVVPVQTLLAVFAALMVLTAITVAVSYFNFGVLNLVVAMAVATVKATLVALYFMHLRYDSGFNAIVFGIGVAFVALFLVVTMLDTIEYQPDVQSWQEEAR